MGVHTQSLADPRSYVRACRRLYAYRKVEVIILPLVEEPSTFAVGPHEWGRINVCAYEHRGWVHCEDSTSRDPVEPPEIARMGAL